MNDCRKCPAADKGCDSSPDVCGVLQSAENDAVAHPKHYNNHPSKIECITITRRLNFNLGNTFKYLFRNEHKGKRDEDLKKALWYIEDEIKQVQAKAEDSVSWDMLLVASYEENKNLAVAYRNLAVAVDFDHALCCLRSARDAIMKEIYNEEVS